MHFVIVTAMRWFCSVACFEFVNVVRKTDLSAWERKCQKYMYVFFWKCLSDACVTACTRDPSCCGQESHLEGDGGFLRNGKDGFLPEVLLL